jgi:hypothetical protein
VAKRSPILGYNHNIGHRGLVFHVQTEDSGVDNPHIFTHLFYGGVILSSRKLDYDASADDSVVKSLMQAQHKAVLKDLKRGAFDEKIDSYLGGNPDLQPRGRSAASLQEAARPATAPGPAAAAPAAQPEMAEDVKARPEAQAEPEAEAQTDPELGVGLVADAPELELEIEIEPDLVEAVMEPPVIEVTPPVASFGPRRGSPIPPAPPPLPTRSGYQKQRLERRDTVEIHSPALPGELPGNGADEARLRPPPIPSMPPVAEERRAPEATARAHGGNVLVSRPPIVVDPRKPAHGSAPVVRSGHMPTPPRTAREESQESLFDQSLISERSLDDVILAYLSEDAGGDD